MADDLLGARGRDPIGKNWTDNFINRYKEVKKKYGILNEDTYNFDETGFMMGVIHPFMVVTSSNRRAGKTQYVQPGNKEWITMIQAINASGWPVLLYIIFAGKVHITTWYKECEMPPNWKVNLSHNGWTNNEIRVAWLKHFDNVTRSRTQGVYRLLIIDGHESHQSITFQNLCKEYKIITLYMPSHSSHLLQPLDVGCFGPLKKAYSYEVMELSRYSNFHVTKEDFLPAFKIAFYKVFIESNIQGAF
ncbi:CENP-B protein [Zopfia rhizophila CBS 207.26]|uniref:CENP-B protein n=1 Tax=Zopfia rhizophila CBS 207.26 TaxID=1314779 RepID=A0A6A6DKZ9_9PEZI|nr:CENP-B protein [Zopfia rhizophila CBS 207.26]